MPARPYAKHAFTLLELLLVVAVIGLLLAILMPALSAASEAGRSVVCETNLNQLFHGSFSYSQANDDRLPYYAGRDVGPRQELQWWVTQIARGMDQFEPKIYRCPADTTPQTHIRIYVHNGTVYMADGLNEVDHPINPFTLTVTYRGSCEHIESFADGFQSRKATSWAHPDKAMELVEGIAMAMDKECVRLDMLRAMSGSADPRVPDINRVRPVRERYTHYESWMRHFGTTNVLFMDGHVAMHTPGQIGKLAWIQEFRER